MQLNASRAYLDAKTSLQQAAGDVDPIVRANAVEAMAQVMGKDAGPTIMQGLSSENVPVVFASAMAAGDVQYESAKPKLLELARLEGPDKRVLAAVIYALNRLGVTSYNDFLPRLLFHREPQVRSVAAMAMGKIGKTSYIQRLERLEELPQPPLVELQVVEAKARLGDPQALYTLESFTKGIYLDDRLMAIRTLAQVNAPRAAKVCRDLLEDDRNQPRVRVVAAEGLGRLGVESPEGFRYAKACASDPQGVLRRVRGPQRQVEAVEVTSLAQLSAVALGWLGYDAAVDTLHPMLRNQNGTVRVAAAMSIMRLLPEQAGGNEPEPVSPSGASPAGSSPETLPKLRTSGFDD
ncbi:MAG: HEAT repeat domain-containing protein [Phycisphaerae bacterium]